MIRIMTIMMTFMLTVIILMALQMTKLITDFDTHDYLCIEILLIILGSYNTIINYTYSISDKCYFQKAIFRIQYFEIFSKNKGKNI